MVGVEEHVVGVEEVKTATAAPGATTSRRTVLVVVVSPLVGEGPAPQAVAVVVARPRQQHEA